MLARFPWWRCNWSGLRKNDCQTLNLALERHVLPPVVVEHPDYIRLQLPEALALYTFRLGVTGKACTQLIGHTRPRAASKGHLPYHDYGASESTSSLCQLSNVISQPQEWLDTCSASVRSDHTQSIASSSAGDEIGREKLMTWETFIADYSPAEDPIIATPPNGYGNILEAQQYSSLPSTFLHDDSHSFTGHQQTTNHLFRPGFRNRCRRVIEEGLHSKHIP